MRVLFFLSIIIAVFCNAQHFANHAAASAKSKGMLTNYNCKLDKLVDSLKVKKTDLRIVITKSNYLLSIVADTMVIKTYPIVLGFNPSDDKLIEGDGCTPEGNFKIKAMYPHKSWSKFLWIDYPTSESWVKHTQAKKNGLIAEDSEIGGEVGIHGVPEGTDYMIDEKENWTLGCVSLKNADINEIYEYAFVGMTVEIVK